jgi:hypothetical protein
VGEYDVAGLFFEGPWSATARVRAFLRPGAAARQGTGRGKGKRQGNNDNNPQLSRGGAENGTRREGRPVDSRCRWEAACRAANFVAC